MDLERAGLRTVRLNILNLEFKQINCVLLFSERSWLYDSELLLGLYWSCGCCTLLSSSNFRRGIHCTIPSPGTGKSSRRGAPGGPTGNQSQEPVLFHSVVKQGEYLVPPGAAWDWSLHQSFELTHPEHQVALAVVDALVDAHWWPRPGGSGGGLKFWSPCTFKGLILGSWVPVLSWRPFGVHCRRASKCVQRSTIHSPALWVINLLEKCYILKARILAVNDGDVPG